MPNSADIREIPVADIRDDRDLQMRVEGIFPATVEEYANEMKAGATFPPITVFEDRDGFWLGNGFHRLAAAKTIDRETIAADVRQLDHYRRHQGRETL
jgi:uncharacterized ParB-like nuclease family protein